MKNKIIIAAVTALTLTSIALTAQIITRNPHQIEVRNISPAQIQAVLADLQVTNVAATNVWTIRIGRNAAMIFVR